MLCLWGHMRDSCDPGVESDGSLLAVYQSLDRLSSGLLGVCAIDMYIPCVSLHPIIPTFSEICFCVILFLSFLPCFCFWLFYALVGALYSSEMFP